MATIGRAQKVLGIAVGERSLIVAEVSGDKQGGNTAKVAEFAYPAGFGIERGEALGKLLAEFLARQGISARKTVWGIPAKWIVLRPYEIPATDRATAEKILWLHATERITQEMGEMAVDYYGNANPAESKEVLLALLPRKKLEYVRHLAAAASLKIDAITPIGFAINEATCGQMSSPMVLSLRAEGAEISIADGQKIVSIRHLGPVKSNGAMGMSADAARPLAAEIRRALANVPGGWDLNGENSRQTAIGRRSMVLWDDSSADPEFLAALADAIGMPITRAIPKWVGINANGVAHSQFGLSAAALTLSSLRAGRPGLDFQNPRLKEPHPPRRQKTVLWASIAAVLLLLLCGWLDMSSLAGRVDDAKTRLAALQPELAIAKPFVAKMEFAASFHSGNPKYVSCLADLTAALPADGLTYLTSFNLHADMKGTAAGKSNTDQNVLELIDKLNAGGRFAQLLPKLDARDIRTTAHETTFIINFVYVPKDVPKALGQTRPTTVPGGK